MDRRRLIKGVGAAGLGVALAPVGSGCAQIPPPPPGLSFKVVRLPDNPIIRPGMDPRMAEEAREYGYDNINGPSLIRVPPWVPNPLGKYYLYFAHHKGEYIRLAFAESPAGPWKIHGPGCLQLKDSHYPTTPPKSASPIKALVSVWKHYPPSAAWALTRIGLSARAAVEEREARGEKSSKETRPHIASPDVMVEHDTRQIRMYYHGMLEDGNQMSRVAVSGDGINFKAGPELIASPYLRMFKYRGGYYGMSMPGLLNRSKDGLAGFEVRPGLLFGVNMRHCALMQKGAILYVFWSQVGDAPERILLSTIDLTSEDWDEWRASVAVEVLRSKLPYEGGDLPNVPSIRGEITRRVNQLRDPAIFEEGGRTYLLYACGGEHAIAIAELVDQ